MTVTPGGLEDRLSALEESMREVQALLPRLVRDTGVTAAPVTVTAATVPSADDPSRRV